jgi:hypothetical protein
VGQNRVFRFREYRVKPDETAAAKLGARCTSGDDAECGEESGNQPNEEALTKWMSEHVAATGHQWFERTWTDSVRVEPGAWQ